MKWDCKMPSCSNVKSDEVGCQEDKDVCSDTRNLSACDETPLKRLDEAEDEDEEDEDVDFNPFLKETLSPEASSSLSSEVEGLDGNAIESGVAGINLVTLASDGHNCDGESEHGDEEVVMQTTVSSERLYDKDTRGIVDADPGSEAVQEKENSSGSRTDVNDAGQGELIDRNIPKPAIDLDTDDAICTRTRARYSLASFTLDELETFLQETDDEDDLQNVDDEEEYRKFLAFVLHGGDGDGCLAQDNEIIDDDEDNDADFEIELEEALESDIDENTKDKTKMEYERGGRRPQTRQNRHQKSNGQSKKKTSTPTKRPLRPLLPVLANVPMSPFSAQDGMMPETTPGSLTSVQDGYNSGFTQHQIGQLHCLIHEHVQLLIQVFCLCVHDSSRQHIASQVQKLIFEMLNKRNEVLAWKTTSYPNTCFCPQYLYPSVSNNIPTLLPTPCALDTNATDEVCSPSNETASWRSGYAPTGQNGSLWNLEGVFWAPQINGPVTTILDVAPLSLAGKFINDVETAVKENRVRNMESSCETRFEKEPLFPLSGCQSITQANSEVPSSPSQQPRKKTLAATLVENTKKQSIALVPKAVMKLAQIFFPLFNPAFYPHKPPAAAVSNRVLFTDSEDELLALGIWEYNTDWKAIQQRFLPCKSKHQIFVRQKNRCSSKAPENSIKAVRRMKTSPLTAEEIACIHEGLRYFKCNWSFVWQFIVPHRDPSLLPRQWRLALGTQKSYKLDAEAKERRRLYEKSRRGKSAGSASWQNAEKTRVEKIVGENNNAEDNVGKTYVHEAFLADWRPSGSNGHTFPNLATNLRADMLSQGVLHGSGQRPQPLVGNTQQFTHPHPSFHFAGVRQLGPEAIKSNISASKTTLNTYKPQYYLQAYRARKPYGKNLVKLAPGLPPVNLPPSVRVVSQSAFRDSQHGASLSVSAARKESIVCEAPNAGRSQGPHVTKAGEKISNSPNHRCTISHTEDSEIANDKRIEDERSNDSDLQMHPLLFQAPEDGHLPYFQLGSGASSSSSFSFFSGNQPQLNLSLLHNPQQESQVGFPGSVHSTESASLSHGIDFHPLLQRTDYTQLRYPFGSVQMQSLANAEPHSTGKTAGKANELDLDIHLSSMSRKERSFKPANSKSNVHDSRFTTETQTSDSLFYQPSGDPLPNSSNLGSGSNSPVLPTEDVHRYLDDMCDQSNPGIVMEQEELSDSEEENEENVEFECEEMTDSEGDEGSGCEQITEMQIEEEPNLAAEKSNTDSEPRTRSHPHRNLSDPGKNTPSLELGLIRQGKDDGNNSSWLRLDSSGAPHCPVSTTGKGHEDSTIKADNLAAKSLALSRPSRSCTKKSLNTDQLVAERRRAVDRNRQIGSAPRIPISRKPRKQARRNDASLNIELNVKKTNCDGEDKVS